MVCTNRKREKKILLFHGLYKPQKRKKFDMRFLQAIDFCHTPMHLWVVQTVSSYKC